MLAEVRDVGLAVVKLKPPQQSDVDRVRGPGMRRQDVDLGGIGFQSFLRAV